MTIDAHRKSERLRPLSAEAASLRRAERRLRDLMQIDEIIDNFELLDEWDDRYRYLIELGRELEPLDEAGHSSANKVQGCVSQVWLETRVSKDDAGEALLDFKGDSDAHIVRGLVALIIALYSHRSAQEILAQDAEPIFERLGLASHLTPQRSNGVRAMVDRVKKEARTAAG